jgi:RNA polymerase sigma factor (TIGR02999 family)
MGADDTPRRGREISEGVRLAPAMSDSPGDTFEALLVAARAGDRGAFDGAFALVYEELRRVASRRAMRLGPGSSMTTTALVHETYLKLAGVSALSTQDRAHFFALAAQAMRQILLDHARKHFRHKRGGGGAHLPLDEALDSPASLDVGSRAEELLDVDAALQKLTGLDPEMGRLVAWRFYVGLTFEEIAELTGASPRTVKRRWSAAKLFLLREMAGGQQAPVQP